MEGKLRHTMCPKCQAIDSWEHCMVCYQVEVGATKEGKQWLLQIEKVAKEIATNTPASYRAPDKEHTGSCNMTVTSEEQKVGNKE